MELRQLQYFQAIGELHSITKAAERFTIAQPSVTIAIQNLEHELGVRLLDRSRKRISLTNEGQFFWQRVNEVLVLLAESVRQVIDYGGIGQGAIRLGITPTTSGFIFPRLFANFHRQYPRIHLSSIEEGSLSVIQLLKQGEIDIGIIILAEIPSFLEILPIATEQIVICIPNGHRLEQNNDVCFTDLSDDPLLLFKEDTYLRHIILRECVKNDITPNIVFSSSQIETIIGLVHEKVGLTFLIESIAKRYANIKTLPLRAPLYVQMGIAWNKTKYMSKATGTFIDFVAASL